jgi:hypothetical protein
MRETVLAALTASFPERSSLLPLTGAGFFPALFSCREAHACVIDKLAAGYPCPIRTQQ